MDDDAPFPLEVLELHYLVTRRIRSLTRLQRDIEAYFKGDVEKLPFDPASWLESLSESLDG